MSAIGADEQGDERAGSADLSFRGDALVIELHGPGPGHRVVFKATGSGETLFVDSGNVIQDKVRGRLLEHLPEHLRDEAAKGLLDLASRLVALPIGKQAAEPQGRAPRFAEPEPWPELVGGAELLSELTRTIRRFVSLNAGAIVGMALWAIHAHAHGLAQISPILALTSPEKRCGKSTALHVLSALVPHPLLASNLTPAVLFRVVEKFRPTVLIDEADTFLGDREELRGILNSGHCRSGAHVWRSVGDDHEPRSFSTWGPKAIAMIGSLGGALGDRAINIRMQRRSRNEPVERLRLDRLGPELEALKRKVARWVIDHRHELANADPCVPAELHDRAADNWRPLLAIADVLSDECGADARRVALVLSDVDDAQESADGPQLLADIGAIFTDANIDRISSAELIDALTHEKDGRWAEWKNGKPLTQAQLARVLKPYGIGPRSVRFEDGTCKGYLLEWFADAFGRYLPPDPEQPAQANSDAAFEPLGHRHIPASVSDSEPKFLSLPAVVVPPVPDQIPAPPSKANQSQLALDPAASWARTLELLDRYGWEKPWEEQGHA